MDMRFFMGVRLLLGWWSLFAGHDVGVVSSKMLLRCCFYWCDGNREIPCKGMITITYTSSFKFTDI